MGVEFGWIIGIAAIIGLVVYLGSCVYHRVWPPIDKVVEALGFGALIPVGVRMVYAAFHAKELCHIVDDTGKHIDDSKLHLTFGEHTSEIVIGGVCIAAASIYSLSWLCRRPTHHHPGGG
jgi:putative Mn2+ efflux pump MntP